MTTVIQRMHSVYDLLGQISAARKDSGYCGPRGRVITATEKVNGYSLTGILKKDNQNRFVLEFELHTTTEAQPLHLMEGALKMATLQSKVPAFTEDENDAVFECLADMFGPISTL